MLKTWHPASRPGTQATATTTVVSVVAVDGHDAGAVLALAACLAPTLGPDLATAIIEAARERAIRFEALHDADETTPVGAAAAINGHSVVVGNRALFERLDVRIERLGDGPERLRRGGEHVVFVSVDGGIAGFLGVVYATK